MVDVQVLQDQLLGDNEETEKSLRALIAEADSEIASLREEVAHFINTTSLVAEKTAQSLNDQSRSVLQVEAALTERLNAVNAALATSTQNGRDRMELQSSAMKAQVEACRAELAGVAQRLGEQDTTFMTRVEEVDQRLQECVTTQQNCAALQEERSSEFDTTLSACQSALQEHSSALQDTAATVHELSQAHEALEEQLTSTFQELSNALHRASEYSAVQCGLLQDDVNTLKDDLTAHVNFTSDSLADLQGALEEGLVRVEGKVQEVAKAAGEHCDARCTELRNSVLQVRTALCCDMRN